MQNVDVVTTSSVVGWIGSICDATQVSEELTLSSALAVLNTINDINSHAINVSLPKIKSLSLISAIDSATFLISSQAGSKEKIVSIKTKGQIISPSPLSGVARVTNTIDQFTKLVLSDMVPDQDAVESITSQIRLQVHKLFAIPLMSNSSANKTMSTHLRRFPI